MAHTFLVSVQQIECVCQLRGVRDFSFMQQRVVCLCVYRAINMMHIVCFTWQKRGDIAGNATTWTRWSPHDLFTCVDISQRCFHMGSVGVCDRFHHLEGWVLINILIISPNASACRASSRPPFPEINMEKCGRGENALKYGSRIPSDVCFGFQKSRY